MVRLVQAKRIPGGGLVFVKAQVPDVKLVDSPVVFKLDQYWVKDSRLQVEESGMAAFRSWWLILTDHPNNLSLVPLLVKFSLSPKHPSETCLTTQSRL